MDDKDMGDTERALMRSFDVLWQIREELRKVDDPVRRKAILDKAIVDATTIHGQVGTEIEPIVRRFMKDYLDG